MWQKTNLSKIQNQLLNVFSIITGDRNKIKIESTPTNHSSAGIKLEDNKNTTNFTIAAEAVPASATAVKTVIKNNMEDPQLADEYVQEFVLDHLEDTTSVGVKREEQSPPTTK